MLHCYENVKYSNKMNSQKGKKHKNQIKKKKSFIITCQSVATIHWTQRTNARLDLLT